MSIENLSANERPILPKGSIISYADIEAVVTNDFGGSRIEVFCEELTQNWYWECDGEICKIISIAPELINS